MRQLSKKKNLIVKIVRITNIKRTIVIQLKNKVMNKKYNDNGKEKREHIKCSKIKSSPRLSKNEISLTLY